MKETTHSGHTVVEIRTSHGGENNEGVLYKIECDTCEKVLWERDIEKVGCSCGCAKQSYDSEYAMKQITLEDLQV